MNEEKSFLDMPIDDEPFNVVTDEADEAPAVNDDADEQKAADQPEEGQPSGDEAEAPEKKEEAENQQEDKAEEKAEIVAQFTAEQKQEFYQSAFNKGTAKAAQKKDAEIEKIKRELEQQRIFIAEQQAAITGVHERMQSDDMIDKSIVKQTEQVTQQQFSPQTAWNVGFHDPNQQDLINQRADLRARKVFGDDYGIKANELAIDIASGLLPVDTLAAIESMPNADDVLKAVVGDDGFKAQVSIAASQSRNDFNGFLLKFNDLASKLNVKSEVEPVLKPKAVPNQIIKSKPVSL